MSLAINAGAVQAVLLERWHTVQPGSFSIDSYEFLDGDDDRAFVLHGGGRSGVCASGFEFQKTDNIWIAGPLTAIQAVSYLR